MTQHQHIIDATEATPVWDLPLRLFHWGMVLVVAIAAITGYFFEEWWLDVHVFAGYSLTALLIFRLIWGFMGSYYSRFHTFTLSSSAVLSHVKHLLTGRSKRYAGHNPIGAWMIVILLSTLLLLVLSGFIVWGGQENNGPLAPIISYKMGEWGEEVHEALAGILMSAIAIHIAGVVVETFLFKHALIKAMITGKKEGVEGEHANASHWHTFKGALVFSGVLVAFIYWVGGANGQPQNLISLNASYQQECGECHPAYHPSLRSAHDWEKIMDDLSNHYGEDARLNDAVTTEIKDYLSKHDASSVDTEVAHKIGRQNTATLRMTDTRYWAKKHKDFSPVDFTRAPVGSKVNCNACHQDAETGRFEDAKIKLPKGTHS